LSTGRGDPEGVRGARCGGIHPDLPTALGEDHEKYSTEVSAATKYSWKAALKGGGFAAGNRFSGALDGRRPPAEYFSLSSLRPRGEVRAISGSSDGSGGFPTGLLDLPLLLTFTEPGFMLIRGGGMGDRHEIGPAGGRSRKENSYPFFYHS